MGRSALARMKKMEDDFVELDNIVPHPTSNVSSVSPFEIVRTLRGIKGVRGFLSKGVVGLKVLELGESRGSRNSNIFLVADTVLQRCRPT